MLNLAFIYMANLGKWPERCSMYFAAACVLLQLACCSNIWRNSAKRPEVFNGLAMDPPNPEWIHYYALCKISRNVNLKGSNPSEIKTFLIYSKSRLKSLILT